MPNYIVTIVIEHFSSTAEQEASDNIQAWKQAISSAITFAAEQVSHGNPFFGAEVTVTQGREPIAVMSSPGRHSFKN